MRGEAEKLRPPDFIVVGGQKTGSTSLARALGRVSGVYVPDRESPLFEDPFYSDKGVRRLYQDLARRQARLVGIKRPDLLCRPEAPARVHHHAPMAIIVIAVRDPVTRAISAYYWYLQHRLLPFLPLNEGMALLLGNAESVWTDYPRATEILSYGMYGAAIERWLRHYDASQVFPLELGRTADQSAVRGLPELLNRLGVQEETVEIRGANEGVYSPWRVGVLRTRSILFPAYLASGRSVLRSRSRLLVDRLGAGAITALDRLVGSRVSSGTEPLLDHAIERELRKYYEKDTEVLTICTGRTFSWSQRCAT